MDRPSKLQVDASLLCSYNLMRALAILLVSFQATEKLALIPAIQHFEVHVGSGFVPLVTP